MFFKYHCRKNFFLKISIGGATEKGANCQAHNNQPHRLVEWVKEQGHRGRGGWQWRSERWGTKEKEAGRKAMYIRRWG